MEQFVELAGGGMMINGEIARCSLPCVGWSACRNAATHTSVNVPGRLACYSCLVDLKIIPAREWLGEKSFPEPAYTDLLSLWRSLAVRQGYGAPSTSTEIIVVNNFYADPMLVREFALKQTFKREPEYHKCQRTASHIVDGTREAFTQLGAGDIRDFNKYSTNGVFQLGLAGDQIVYHSDSQQWAATVYLHPDPPPGSGTSFYKSHHTGLRYPPSEADVAKFNVGRGGFAVVQEYTAESLEAAMYGGKLLDVKHWEKVDEVGNVFNRLVIWRGPMVHAVSGFFGSCKETGRLNQLFFFDADQG